MSLALGSLLEGLEPTVVRGDPVAVRVAQVSSDSRRIRPGGAFVAVRGHGVDGHRFLDRAVEAGAVALVVESDEALPAAPDVTVVRVANTRRALGRMVRRLYGAPDRALEVIAVTGTNGKTTVSHLVRDLVRAGGQFCGLVGTIRYETPRRSMDAPLTTPAPEDLLELLGEMRDGDARAVAMEASSHALDQERLAGIEVDVAAFTNLGHEHLDYHRTLDAYLDAKCRLLDHLAGPDRQKPVGRAVVNLDAPLLAAREWPADSITVGTGDGATLRLREARCTREGIEIDLVLEGRDVRLESRLLGRYNVENLLVTAGIGHALGLDPDEIARRFPSLRPVPGRLEPVPLERGPLVLVDYAHTPDGIESVLGAVRELGDGPVTLVFGCGGDRDRAKRPLMARAAVAHADRVVLTTDNPRTEDPARIFADTEAGFGRGADRVERVEDRHEALARALDVTPRGGTVVVAGKGHETYQIIGTEKQPWDDRQALREAWSERGER